MKLPDNPPVSESSVDMIPLIDVVFLILVAFIYASMYMSQKTGLPVNLPVASHAQSELYDVLVLNIKRDGALFLNKAPVTVKQLEKELLNAKKTSDEKLVLYVMADREAQLNPLIQVMDLARKVGITGLTIAAEKQASPEK